MLADPGFEKRPFRDPLPPRGAHLVERALHQDRADAAAAEFRRHLGVDEGDDLAVHLVVGGSEMAVDHELKAMVGLVIDDVAHSSFQFPLLPISALANFSS